MNVWGYVGLANYGAMLKFVAKIIQTIDDQFFHGT